MGVFIGLIHNSVCVNVHRRERAAYCNASERKKETDGERFQAHALSPIPRRRVYSALRDRQNAGVEVGRPGAAVRLYGRPAPAVAKWGIEVRGHIAGALHRHTVDGPMRYGVA